MSKFDNIQRKTNFERQVIAYVDDLLKTATHILKNRQDAEDAVQEAYFRAWKYFESFDPSTDGRPWMYRILFNVINGKLGKRAKLAETPFEAMENADLPASKVLIFDPVASLDGSEVVAATEKLSAEHRSVLLLVIVEEFSYKETADILDIPVGTVMSRLHRARKEIRAILNRKRATGTSH
ncbi:MAG: sigma-70 family RNA polymerase sigma factor [Acidobacteriota bacterium]